MSDELKLTPEEIQRGIIDEKRAKLRQKFEMESAQGILPFTNERFFEQSNPIVRSALFTAGKINIRLKSQYLDWTEIFSLGNGSIHYRGPLLTVDHEIVLVRLMALARGHSLTKPIHATQADLVRWLDLDTDSGANYVKARRILDDLGAAELRITSKPALEKLLSILTSPALADMSDGKFFQEYVKNRFGDQLKMIAHGIENDHPIDVSLGFITNQTHNRLTKRMLINLDPIAAIFFDGVNTTMVPFEVWDKLDRFGKKLLPLIASHKAGVYPYMLEKYHEFSGSKSEYAKIKRRFKSELKKRFEDWEQKKYIIPGWKIERNSAGAEVVSGLKTHESVRLRSKLEIPMLIDSDEDRARGSDEAIEQRVNQLADSFQAPRPASRRSKQQQSAE